MAGTSTARAVATGASAGTGVHLTATSTTAMSITGNIVLAPDRIVFQNGASLHLVLVRQVPDFADDLGKVAATLYRLDPPGNPVLKRRQPTLRLVGQGTAGHLRRHLARGENRRRHRPANPGVLQRPDGTQRHQRV